MNEGKQNNENQYSAKNNEITVFDYFDCKMFSRNLDIFDNLEFGPLFFSDIAVSTTKLYATI